MADTNEMQLAQQVFEDLCRTLDEDNWKYESFPEDLSIHFISIGEDIPMEFLIRIDAERQIITLLSPIPVDDNKNKRLDLAIAACAASYGLADGSFDYDVRQGRLMFRMTASFRESTIGKGLFMYLVGVSQAMVDRYNDIFFAISKGMLSVDDFLAAEA